MLLGLIPLWTILSVEALALFVSALFLAPVALVLAISGQWPGPKVLGNAAAWGALVLVCGVLLARFAFGN